MRTTRTNRIYRHLEKLGILIGSLAIIHGQWLMLKGLDFSISSFVFLLSAIVLGLIAADFISGIVHRFADTIGDESWPVLGSTLIRPFREHHADPASITRHDFVETNGSSFLLVGVVWILLCLIFELPLIEKYLGAISPMLFFLCMTNEVHKMAHLGSNASGWHRVLARRGLLLSATAHRKHHSGKFDSHYCITTGWLNSGLERIRFFKLIESAVKLSRDGNVKELRRL